MPKQYKNVVDMVCNAENIDVSGEAMLTHENTVAETNPSGLSPAVCVIMSAPAMRFTRP